MKMIRRLLIILAICIPASAGGLTVRDNRGKPRDAESVIADVSSARAVFVGESHDRYDEHLSELEIIRQLYERDSESWAIGVEFIQRPFQKALDDYISGAISEKDFLEKTEYFDRWGFDFRLYRPIFQFAREHHIPMVALNAERELTQKVAKVGLEGLTAAERAQLPEPFDKSDKRYRKRLEKVFRDHMKGMGTFEHFWEAQLTWDETMADRAAAYLSAHPDKSIVVLAGAGHIESGSGIPNRVRRHLPNVKTAVLIAEDKPEKGHVADYFLISKEEILPPAPKMGIVMEDKDGVRVKAVTSGGPAAATGIQVKDRILSIDDQEVKSMAAVRLAMLDKNVGDSIVIRIQREGSADLRFDLKLQ